LIIDPNLPEWLPELTLTDIRVGNARVGLRLRRDASGHTEHEVIERRGELRIHRPLPSAGGFDRYARFVREIGLE
jgi:hypothetical protein